MENPYQRMDPLSKHTPTQLSACLFPGLLYFPCSCALGVRRRGRFGNATWHHVIKSRLCFRASLYQEKSFRRCPQPSNYGTKISSNIAEKLPEKWKTRKKCLTLYLSISVIVYLTASVILLQVCMRPSARPHYVFCRSSVRLSVFLSVLYKL